MSLTRPVRWISPSASRRGRRCRASRRRTGAASAPDCGSSRRWPTGPGTPAAPRRARAPRGRGVDDAHLVPRQRASAGDEAQRVGVVGRCRARPGLARLKGSRRTRSMRGPRPSGGHSRPTVHSARPYTGVMRLGPEAVAREALGEAAQRLGQHRLGAVDRDAPGAEIQALDLRVVDALHAQLVGEVRRRRQRAAVAVDRPQPALRARQEGERRHHAPAESRSTGWRATRRSGPCRDRAAASSRTRRPAARRAPGRWRGCWRAGWRA